MEQKYLLLAKNLIKAQKIKDVSFVASGHCGRDRRVIKTPLKSVVGSMNKKFIFDETTCIPLVSRCYLNMAETVGCEFLKMPSEVKFYEDHKDVEDIDKLIEMAVPVVAKSLRLFALLDELQFDDVLNEAYVENLIDEYNLKIKIVFSPLFEKYLTKDEQKDAFNSSFEK